MTKYLKNINDGFIYEWHPILAKNPLCVEVSEEEVFPERFVKPAVVELVEKRKRQGRRPVDLSVNESAEQEEFKFEFPELNADASRRLPK